MGRGDKVGDKKVRRGSEEQEVEGRGDGVSSKGVGEME